MDRKDLSTLSTEHVKSLFRASREKHDTDFVKILRKELNKRDHDGEI